MDGIGKLLLVVLVGGALNKYLLRSLVAAPTGGFKS